MSHRNYEGLLKIETFEDRLKYLLLSGNVGEATFGGHRYINQILYKSSRWVRIRREVILRDNGCDLAHSDYSIGGSIYIHHINPITIDDVLEEKACVFDLNNLVCSSFKTHNAIHYGADEIIFEKPAERTRHDTCLWR